MFSLFSKSKKPAKSPSPPARAAFASAASSKSTRSTRKLLSEKGRSITAVVNPVTKKLLELNILFEDVKDKYFIKEKQLSNVGISKTEKKRLEKELDKMKGDLEKIKNQIIVFLDISIRSVTGETDGGKAKNRTQKKCKK
jgi:hypothetical protein